MSLWVSGCQRVYRGLSRAFPHEFRMVCGDGLERLGEDLAPRIWQEQGPIGLARLLADIALRLPFEYFLTWIAKLKEEATMSTDLLEGTWKGIMEKSEWDPKYTPEQAFLRFEANEMGYILFSYGVKEGQAVADRPVQLIPDGKRRPVTDLNGRPIPGCPPGVMAYANWLDPLTIEGWAEVDGKPLGGGTYRLSEDGKTLTVTTNGTGVKGPFKILAVFERVPEPSLPRS